MTFEDEHVGKKLLRIDISMGCNDAVYAAVDPSVNEAEIAAQLQAGIREVIARVVGPHLLWRGELDDRPIPVVEISAEIIEDRERRKAKWDDNLEKLGVMFRAADVRRNAEIDAHTDNGKQGVWQVDGVRHDTLVMASTAREAVDKAIASGEVGDWESPTAHYLRETL